MEFQNTNELIEKASKFEYEKSENLVQIFKDNHIYFPEFVHRFILLNLLKKYIFSGELMAAYTDEYKYKLRSYNYFSIYILEKAIIDYNIDVKAHEYKNLFMRFFLKNESKFKTSVALEKSLEAIERVVPKKEESIKVCLNEFHSLYYTPKGYLDGISLSILKEAITQSYNINEMRELALKYEVDLPRRINKTQLIELLCARLLLTEEEKESILTKPISEICAFAKTKGFKISSDLKKQDMVEYLIFSLNKYHEEVEKDIYNYDIILDEEIKTDNVVEQDEVLESDQGLPTSSELVDAPEIVKTKEVVRNYNVEDTQVEYKDYELEEINIPSEEPIEEIKEEPTVEEVSIIEPIIEEPIIEDIKETIIEEPIKEIKEESKVEPLIIETKEKEAPTLEFDDYDEKEDEEIRNIIKKYYYKKNIKDKRFKYLVLGLLGLILIGIIILILMK